MKTGQMVNGKTFSLRHDLICGFSMSSTYARLIIGSIKKIA